MTLVIINPNSTEAMTAGMLEVARNLAPDQVVEGWTSHYGPPAIQGAEDGAAAVPPLLELVAEADRLGATGIILGCFDDTGLAEAAELARCPVLGLGQAAYHTAALRQWRFSVVTTLSVSVPVLEENILSYGLSGYLGRVRASDIPVLELETDPAAVARIAAEITAAHAEEGAQAIVLGCAGMTGLSEELRIHAPVPIIDPVEAAVRFVGAVG
ncbi:MAG: aspartate/glutamate racemase family protein [Pseudomonadota bacterium]